MIAPTARALLRPKALWAVEALAPLFAPAREYGGASRPPPAWGGPGLGVELSAWGPGSAPIAVEKVVLAILRRLQEHPQARQEHAPPCDRQAGAKGVILPQPRAHPRDKRQACKCATQAEPDPPSRHPGPQRQTLVHQGRDLLQGTDTFPPQGQSVPLLPAAPQQEGIACVTTDRRAHGIGLEQVYPPGPGKFLQHLRGGLESGQCLGHLGR